MQSLLGQKTVREGIYDCIKAISPLDSLEKEHISDTLTWIAKGDLIFRIAKPDIPLKHLVSYFVLFDEGARKILLVDHKKAQLWLPAGGHVEMDEYPKETVKRECFEELDTVNKGIDRRFKSGILIKNKGVLVWIQGCTESGKSFSGKR